MASIITVEEIQAIFDEADRLKAKGGGGGGNSVETRVSILTLSIFQTIISLTAGFYLKSESVDGEEVGADEAFLFQHENEPEQPRGQQVEALLCRK